jgi:hypothetical protein
MSIKSKATGIVIGSLFVFAVTVTSARADSVHSLWLLPDLERDRLGFQTHVDFGEMRHIGSLRSDHLDNGRHLGFFKSESDSPVSNLNFVSESVSPVSNLNSVSSGTFSFSDANQSREFQGGFTVEKNSQLASASFSLQASVTPNPEPTTMLLFGSGLAALGAYARRKFHH